MKRYFVAMAALLLGLGIGSGSPAVAGGPHDKATGGVTTINPNHPERWHSFEFAAHELDGGPAGKGYLIHEELNGDGTVTEREEFCPIVYVIAEDNVAWFAGPILYDSAMAEPTRWMILKVIDGGQPGRGHDYLWWGRPDDETAVLQMLGDRTTPPAPGEPVRGNLTVHSR